MSAGVCAFEDVDDLHSVYRETPWAFARDRADEIDAHWAQLCVRNPALFDGRVLLMDGCSLAREGGRRILRTQHFATNFRAFLAFRDFGEPDAGVRNCFAAAALLSSDGAFVLGEMGAHTANAGRVYFPCGTPDMDDVRDGRVDLAGSVLRELEEETGMGADAVAPDPGWTVVFEGPRVACIKIVRTTENADALAARISRFLAQEAQPELAGVRVVRAPTDLEPGAMPDYVVGFLTRWFAQLAG